MNKASGGKAHAKTKSARELALLVLQGVDEHGAYANIELNRILEAHKPEKQERAFATELVYGTLRNLQHIDHILSQFIKRPLKDLTVWVRNILRLGVYQLKFVERIPASAACNESVNLVKKYGHKGVVAFANGVLRNIGRNLDNLKYPSLAKDPVGHISIVYSHPQWMVQRWLEQFGVEATIQLCQTNNQAASLTARVNTLKISRAELMERLQAQGIKTQSTRWSADGLVLQGVDSLHSLDLFQQGLFQIQDESSMLVAPVVDPQPHQLVVDTSAAPGGKTTHLGQLMQNQGTIYACDLHPHKLELIKENCQRLGIDIVQTFALDATQLPQEWTGRANRVLVDAPCSGLGVLRRRPDARWRKEAGDLVAIQQLQLAILASAANLVQPGGVLVYSTCTITPEENQEVVQAFLADHPEFQLDALAPYLPADFPLEQPQAGWVQILPHLHDMDGFFIARMVKKAE